MIPGQPATEQPPVNGNTEPVWTANGLTALVQAALSLFIAFGLNLTLEQKASIIAVVVILAPIIATLYIRPKVTPLIAPKDEDNVRLVRITDKGMTNAQARSLHR